MSAIDPTLAGVLACPVDKAAVIEDPDRHGLVCTECGRRYPVEDGIPIMVVDQAEGGDSD